MCTGAIANKNDNDDDNLVNNDKKKQTNENRVYRCFK